MDGRTSAPPRPAPRTFGRLRLAGTVLAALSALNGLAIAGEPWLRPSQLPERRHEISTLKSLGIMPAELVLRGEAARHAWPVYLEPDEAARITRFQFGFLNAVSVLPQRSRLTVSINNRSVAEIVADSAEAPSLVSIPLPQGLVLPGMNIVQIATALVPGAACPATCELWALLEPALSGFVLPATPGGVSDDLPGSMPIAPVLKPVALEALPAVEGPGVTLRRSAAVDSDLTGSGFELASYQTRGPAPASDIPAQLDARRSGESQPDPGGLHGQGIGPGGLAVMVLLAGLGVVMPTIVRNAGIRP